MKPSHAAASSQFMTTAEVAQLLRVNQSTIYRLLRQRQIPALRIGSDYRFDKDAIEKWMAGKQAKRQPN
jgi:excisionase family DNA binding protein